MIRHSINSQFTGAVLEGRKVTTIRDKAWPVGVPVMLYNWSGVPYRSKQVEVAPVVVTEVVPVMISRNLDGGMQYMLRCELIDVLRGGGPPLWQSEGFSSREEMDEWFRKLVNPGGHVSKVLMRFRKMLVRPEHVPVWGGCPPGCGHSYEDHVAFDWGIYDGEKGVQSIPMKGLPYALFEAWQCGEAVGRMNRRASAADV